MTVPGLRVAASRGASGRALSLSGLYIPTIVGQDRFGGESSLAATVRVLPLPTSCAACVMPAQAREATLAGERPMARPTAPASIRRKQRTALIMLVIAGTLNYLDRSTLSIANPLIR